MQTKGYIFVFDTFTELAENVVDIIDKSTKFSVKHNMSFTYKVDYVDNYNLLIIKYNVRKKFNVSDLVNV